MRKMKFIKGKNPMKMKQWLFSVTEIILPWVRMQITFLFVTIYESLTYNKTSQRLNRYLKNKIIETKVARPPYLSDYGLT